MNEDLGKKKSVVDMLNNKRLIGENYKKAFKFNKENVYLGEIREFTSEDNGKISVDIYSYLFLVKGKDGLLNPLCLSDTDNYAVYRPSKELANKYIYVQGEEKDGPCIVVSPFTKKVRNQFDSEVVSLVDLQKYVLGAKGFFKDREEIIRENFINPITIHKLLKDDNVKKEKYNSFMEESTKQLRK